MWLPVGGIGLAGLPFSFLTWFDRPTPAAILALALIAAVGGYGFRGAANVLAHLDRRGWFAVGVLWWLLWALAGLLVVGLLRGLGD